MSPLELVDDRFGKLTAELRASRPVPSAALRERVAELGRLEREAPRWSFHLPSRRIVLGLAAAAVLASFLAAGVLGLTRSGGRQSNLGAQQPERTKAGAVQEAPASDERLFRAQAPTAAAIPFRAVVPPSAARLQRYEAVLRLRVKGLQGLSDATKRAMTLTRTLGGYVASVRYATRGGQRGGATLVLRVPVSKVQTALADLTSLGTILRQQTGILDVTRRADRESRQIAKLERQLETASPSQAAALKLRLKALRARHARLLRSAQLARITLSLTTPAPEAAAAPSRFDRTLDDAGAVLVRELEILLYAVVVAGPLLLLGAAAIAAARAQRRRSDRRLLERA